MRVPWKNSHISALLDNCFPDTSFEVALEHAVQYERKKEAEEEKKNNKQKSEAIDQIDEEDDNQPNQNFRNSNRN